MELDLSKEEEVMTFWLVSGYVVGWGHLAGFGEGELLPSPTGETATSATWGTRVNVIFPPPSSTQNGLNGRHGRL